MARVCHHSFVPQIRIGPVQACSHRENCRRRYGGYRGKVFAILRQYEGEEGGFGCEWLNQADNSFTGAVSWMLGQCPSLVTWYYVVFPFDVGWLFKVQCFAFHSDLWINDGCRSLWNFAQKGNKKTKKADSGASDSREWLYCAESSFFLFFFFFLMGNAKGATLRVSINYFVLESLEVTLLNYCSCIRFFNTEQKVILVILY